MKKLICFITCGFPDLRTTEKIVSVLENAGVDIVELGMPFSDPIADGTVVQYASQKALEKKGTVKDILSVVRHIRKKSNIPIVLMGYLNPVYQYGLKKFFNEAKESGVSGLIIPDIIPEESKLIKSLAKRAGIDLIYLLAPTTEPKRRKIIYNSTTGFVYVVSVTGITGARKELPSGLAGFLKQIRRETKKPLALGFGISQPKQVTKIKKYIDGIIIGSALIKIIMRYRGARLVSEIRKFILPFRKELGKV